MCMEKVKNYLIIALLGLTLVFGYKWFFSNDKVSEDKIEQLNILNQKLDQQIIENNIQINNLSNEVNTLLESIRDKELVILDLEKDVEVSDALISDYKKDLNAYRLRLEKTREEIEKLKKDPIKRTGSDLLNSLSSKIN
jgi:cell division protein FtsB